MKKIDFGQDLGGIGRRMRQVRELNELSQGRMARLVGIENQSTYGNYEAGRSVPLDFVIHYHKVCNEQLGIRFTLDWLLKGVGDGPERGRNPLTAGGALAAGLPDGNPFAQPRTQSALPEARNIDERISEHIARSTEILKALLKRKYETKLSSGEPSLHPFLGELPFAVMDLMSVIRYASPGACKLFKTTAEAAVGQSSLRFGKSAFQNVVPEQIESTLKKGYWIGEIEAHTSRFEPLPVVMIMWLMRDEEQNPCMGVVVVPKDEISRILEELKSLELGTIKDHMAWEEARIPDKPKSSPSETE